MDLFLSIAIVVVRITIAVVLRRIVANAESGIENEAVRAATDVDDSRSRIALNVSVRVVAVRVQVFALVDVIIVANVAGLINKPRIR